MEAVALTRYNYLSVLYATFRLILNTRPPSLLFCLSDEALSFVNTFVVTFCGFIISSIFYCTLLQASTTSKVHLGGRNTVTQYLSCHTATYQCKIQQTQATTINCNANQRSQTKALFLQSILQHPYSSNHICCMRKSTVTSYPARTEATASLHEDHSPLSL